MRIDHIKVMLYIEDKESISVIDRMLNQYINS